MAGNFSQAFQQDILQTVVDATGAPSPLTAATMWFHLYNTTLNDANTPATTGRCAGANYTPQNIVNTTASWTNPNLASPSTFKTKVLITFTTNASTGWGEIKALQITSSSGTGGVSYMWSDVLPNQTVSEGNTVQITTGGFGLSLT